LGLKPDRVSGATYILGEEGGKAALIAQKFREFL